MKTLKDYIISEKLKLDANIKMSEKLDIPGKYDTVKINFPYIDWGGPGEAKTGIWKTMTIPTAKYVVFSDKYRADKMHFGEIGDMLISMAYNQDDYEDFTPNDDILYASDNFYDVFNWYCKEIGINVNKYRGMEAADIKNDISKLKNKHWAYDDSEFFTNVITGEWKKGDFNNYNFDFSNDFEDEINSYL